METLIFHNELGASPEIIRQGGLVIVPTETVYGLAANAYDAEAVAEIYRVKGRPEVKPISLLVASMRDVERVCTDIPQAAYRLAERFWPGPLTMILPKAREVPEIVAAGGSTLGVRCPASPLTLALIRESGAPLAAPSANPSGEPGPVNAEEAAAYFLHKVPCILDGGPCTVGVASTILDLTVSPPRILRQGGLAEEILTAALREDGLC